MRIKKSVIKVYIYIILSLTIIAMSAVSCSKESTINSNSNNYNIYNHSSKQPAYFASYGFKFQNILQSTSIIDNSIFQFCDGGFCYEFSVEEVEKPIHSYTLSTYDDDYIHCSTSYAIVDGPDTLFVVKGVKYTSQIYVYKKKIGNLEVIRKVSLPFDNYYPNFAVDSENKILYILTYKNNTMSVEANNAIEIQVYPYYDAYFENIGPLTETFTVPFVPISQDTFYLDGNIFLAFGDPTSTMSGVMKINVENKDYEIINFRDNLPKSEEPEGVFCYKEKIWVTTVLGNIYVVE